MNRPNPYAILSGVDRASSKQQEPLIHLTGVEKVYRLGKVRVPALRGLDLTVDRGEFVAIMGPSGSGKSTLMHLIGCLDRPSSGTILVNGLEVSRLGERERAEIRGQQIGFVFQSFNLIPTLTALENVALPLVFQGVGQEEREWRAGTLLGKVDLAARIDHRPTELSGGEQQRVAIARALVNDPRIVLADEPTGEIDSEAGQAIMRLLRRLNQEGGKTVVLVTHDPMAAKFADRIVHIRDGQVVEMKERLPYGC
ncbi:MAG: ABC transporter ATP-binding protein [Candidatus Bipolaricaulia bacterium]